jgi:hypothetical protein
MLDLWTPMVASAPVINSYGLHARIVRGGRLGFCFLCEGVVPCGSTSDNF